MLCVRIYLLVWVCICACEGQRSTSVTCLIQSPILFVHSHIYFRSICVSVCTCLSAVFACRGQERALGVLPYHFLPLLGGRVSPWTWGFHFLGRLARSQHVPAASCLGILQSWDVQLVPQELGSEFQSLCLCSKPTEPYLQLSVLLL